MPVNPCPIWIQFVWIFTANSIMEMIPSISASEENSRREHAGYLRIFD